MRKSELYSSVTFGVLKRKIFKVVENNLMVFTHNGNQRILR